MSESEERDPANKQEPWVLQRKNPFAEKENPFDLRALFPSKEEDFFHAGGAAVFDPEQGSLRRQLLDKSTLLDVMKGYCMLRPAMKTAFSGVSRDKTDNGWIETLDEFRQLMQSVGENLPEKDYVRLWGMCTELPNAFNGQREGSVVFEQWVKIMLQTKDEAKDPSDKLFGLF